MDLANNILPTDPLKHLRDFYNENIGKKCVVFGAGNNGKKLKQIFYLMGISIDYFAHNTTSKDPLTIDGIPVFPFEKLLEDRDHVMIFVASIYYEEIEQQLIDHRFTLFYDCSEILFYDNKVYGIQGFKQFYKDRALERYFCPIPFEHFHAYDTASAICCPQYVGGLLWGQPGQDSVDDMWNSPIAQQIRASVLDGSYCFCDFDLCPHYANGLPLKDQLDDPFYRDIIEKRLTRIEGGPRILHISIDPSCNLNCKMCLRDRSDKRQDPLYTELTEKVIQHRWDNVEHIIIAGNGELFYSPHYKRILEAISETNFPRLKKITLLSNGTLFSQKMWDTYSSLFDRYDVEVIISVDAYTEETYQKIRRNGDFHTLRDNLNIISRMRKSQRISRFQLNFCVQNDNYIEMEDFAKWGGELGADIVWFQKIYSNKAVDCIHEKNHPHYRHFQKILQSDIFKEAWVDISAFCT